MEYKKFKYVRAFVWIGMIVFCLLVWRLVLWLVF
jgi:hypothetical protein